MIKRKYVRKQPVAVTAAPRPSRIRREPPPVVTRRDVRPYPTEREVWMVVIGVLLFACAITFILMGFSDITSK